MKKIFALILLVFTTITPVLAASGQTTLLTVTNEENRTGGTADIYLEIQPGTGRVFMDSFPLTEVDTQISTRFAKEVACDYLDVDCSKLDFFYTIRAKSSIVGGPSAGAAITILTISVLDNQPIKEDVVMTGTINSGGIIGPVAGIQEKAEAAKDKGFSKVLIPKWSILPDEATLREITNATNESNITIKYADSLQVDGIQVITVSTIEEALTEFTGKEYSRPKEIVIPNSYQSIMSQVAEKICERTEKLRNSNISLDLNTSNSTNETYQKGLSALATGDYYSAASYCFTTNTKLRSAQFSEFDETKLDTIKYALQQETGSKEEELDKRELKTISDLETYIIVKERYTEVLEALEKENTTPEELGYLYERHYSGIAWSEFFKYPGQQMTIDEDHLAEACLSKTAEAEERLNYLRLIILDDEESDRTELDSIKQAYENKEYAFCLFRAAKLKADTGTILSTIAITNEKLPELIQDHLTLAEHQIARQSSFPILGYSYYNYANSLKEDREYLALLFAGYSTELSNLKMYFPIQKKPALPYKLGPQFYAGAVAGILFTAILFTATRLLTKKN